MRVLRTADAAVPTQSGVGPQDHLLIAGKALQAARERSRNLSAAELSAEIARVHKLIGQAEAYRVALVHQLGAQEPATGDAVARLKQEHHLDHGQAVADVRAGRALAALPKLRAAAEEGRLPRPALDAIVATGTRNAAREAALPEAVDTFIEMAGTAPLSAIRKSLDMWAEQIDPKAAADDDHDAHQRREFNVRQVRDGVRVDGFFSNVSGMRLITALNGALDKQWRASHDPGHTGHATSSDAVSASTSAQRADAFIDGIINPALDAGLLPSCGGAPATVTVTIPLERLQQPELAADAKLASKRLAAGTLRHRSPVVAASNGPGAALVSTSAAAMMACDATVQRVVLSPAGKPLDIGRKTRVIPDHMRTALVLRDDGCIFPHCDRPPGWTQAHHVQHWSQGGRTSLDNLIPNLSVPLHHARKRCYLLSNILRPRGRTGRCGTPAGRLRSTGETPRANRYRRLHRQRRFSLFRQDAAGIRAAAERRN